MYTKRSRVVECWFDCGTAKASRDLIWFTRELLRKENSSRGKPQSAIKKSSSSDNCQRLDDKHFVSNLFADFGYVGGHGPVRGQLIGALQSRYSNFRPVLLNLKGNHSLIIAQSHKPVIYRTFLALSTRVRWSEHANYAPRPLSFKKTEKVAKENENPRL